MRTQAGFIEATNPVRSFAQLEKSSAAFRVLTDEMYLTSNWATWTSGSWKSRINWTE